MGYKYFHIFAIVYDLLPAVGWQTFSLLWVDSDDRRAQHTRFQSQILYKACAYYLVFVATIKKNPEIHIFEVKGGYFRLQYKTLQSMMNTKLSQQRF